MTRRIVVYDYWTWIAGEGLGQIAPVKRSLPDIEARHGLVILTSAEEVDAAQLAEDGSYTAPPGAKIPAE
ncbi:hypothetical protein [Acidisoma sp. 7E03]